MTRRRLQGVFGGCFIAAAILFSQAVPGLAADSAPVALPGTPASEVEPNGSAATASAIVSGQRVRAPLFPSGDIDYYRFDAQAGDRVFAATMTAGSTSSTDSQLSLIASNGATVLEKDNDNGSFSATSSSIAGAPIPSAGTYYLKVEDFTPGTTTERPYDLYFQLRSGAATAEVEPNDTAGQANPLGAGFVSGKRDPAEASEQDWYSVSLKAGDTVFLSLDLDPERDGTSFNGRVGFGLAGDADDQILFADDPGGLETPNPIIPSEAFFMTVKKSGTYYAVVDAASPAVGGPTATYQLSATVMPAAQELCRSYATTPSPGTIADAGTTTFPIPVADPGRVGRVALGLDLNHQLMGDLDVSLRAPAGNEVPIFTDIGAGTSGVQTHMDALFDRDAAIPPSFSAVRPLMLQPENVGRLDWFQGQQQQGTWNVVVRDDAGANTGSLARADLILCGQPEEEPNLDEVYSTGFESGTEGFVHTGTQDEWERGLPATPEAAPVAGLNSCAHGTGCFKTDLDGTYNSSSSQDLLSPSISLAGRTAGPIYVSWEQWYQMDTATSDHATVSVELAGSASPRTLFAWSDGAMSSSVGISSTLVPSSAGWGLHRVDISEYAGKTIRLRFHLDSDPAANYAGLAIDDVRVTAAPKVTPPPAAPPTTRPAASLAPTLTKVTLTNSRFATVKKVGSKKKVGTTFNFTLSEPASVKIAIERRLPGYKSGGKCVSKKPASGNHGRCTFYKSAKSLSVTGKAGANAVKFSGKGLPLGLYRVSLVATDADGLLSETTRVAFTVVRP